ncbi:Poly(A) polymerase [Actinidia chinensis var. chinensis]|uniref:Poly(A) polymerase n=1 Tax=Actinidia chinensis var. chinensis TaxID=1590841 RepID=A0A2R6P2V0_ACTCC|nr:Poly(A) polymerase [Actinidia chinensis var. chinensis]
MAIAIQGLACRTLLSFTRPLVRCVRKIKHSSSVAAVESIVESVDVNKEKVQIPKSSSSKSNGDRKAPEWKKLSSKDLGIRTSMIGKPTRLVLNGLKEKGYEVYLVGGCVRDLILKRIPKDFDIITSAELKEVLRTFPRCEVVGRRFPICHVHVDDTIIEVSSFSTSGRKFGRKSNYSFRRPRGCNEHDFIRWRNCLHRDFTINGLMFDPFAKVVYDYMGGIEDIKKAKVRTVIAASTSFVEDCARILRGMRIAARLGFRFSRETAHSMRELSTSVLRLDKGRILMEMNYMLAYGSAEASLRLLWKFGLLEILLPIQAAYFVSKGFRRRDTRSNMLLSLFSSLDRLLAPDRPCDSRLWIGILAFHKALVDHPRDPLVVAAFSIALHSGGSLTEAVNIARSISQPHEMSFNELLEPGSIDSNDALIGEVMDLAVSVKTAICKMTDEHFVSQAMIEYPQAPHSDLVFISPALTLKVVAIFERVRGGKERGFVPKRGSKIDYEALALGRLNEVRHMFARIVFDTVYPPQPNNATPL